MQFAQSRKTRRKVFPLPLGLLAAALVGGACQDEGVEAYGEDELAVADYEAEEPLELDADLRAERDPVLADEGFETEEPFEEDLSPERAVRPAEATFGRGAAASPSVTLPLGPRDEVLQIERVGGQDSVRVGEELSYTIQIKNVADTPVHDVVVTELVPRGFEVSRVEGAQHEREDAGSKKSGQSKDSGKPSKGRDSGESKSEESKEGGQGQSKQGSEGQAREASAQKDASGKAPGQQGSEMREERFRLGKLMPGETREIRVSGVPTQEGQITSCLLVDYQPSICTTIDVVAPDLVLSRSFGQDTYYVCEDIEVVYMLHNVGDAPSGEVRITEDLPEGLTTSEAANRVEIDVPAVEPGEMVEERIVLRAERAVELEGRAKASTDAMEVQSGTGSVQILAPELEVSVDGPDEQYLQRDVTYSVTVRNTSDDPALQTIVRVPSVASAERLSVSTQAIERKGDEFWIGELPGGESRSFEVSLSPAETGEMNFEVMAAALCADEVRDSVSTTIKGVEAILLEVIDLEDPVAVGEETTYEVRVLNQGSAKSINVQLSADLPDALEFVGADGPTQVQAQEGKLQFEPVPELPPGEMVSWQVRVNAKEAAKVQFKVELTSEATRRAVVEHEPTTLF